MTSFHGVVSRPLSSSVKKNTKTQSMQFHELKKENDQSATVQMIKLFT